MGIEKFQAKWQLKKLANNFSGDGSTFQSPDSPNCNLGCKLILILTQSATLERICKFFSTGRFLSPFINGQFINENEDASIGVN